MSVDNATFFFFAILFAASVAGISSQCVQQTPCSCLLANGEGYDLSKIANGSVLGSLQPSKNNNMFYFHPCTNYDITKGTDKPELASVWLHTSNATKNTSLGTVEETKMELIHTDMLTLVIRHKIKDVIVNTTTIKLFCDPSATTNLVAISDEAPNVELHLTSPYACQIQMVSSGLSTGSVLVILLFVFSGIYLIGGALALKFLRGATGWEMLPNHTFWSDLPALVRDGILFSISGCKVDSYNQI